ncbi:nickel pincer cofactor biosynthesis protein LarC [Planctomicrobium sp. SH668]|uniref:nickel pincer cofactor biosynthesis protein LarC n=1 Tax=Planctomicrobium sp. SH668 TaxID=3448126 RepID=UPI003F5C1934
MMKIAYFECATGISGDMTLAALIDAGVDLNTIRDGVASLDLPGVEIHVSEVTKSCFRAKSVKIVHPEQQAHRHLAEILNLLSSATKLTQHQRELASQIFLALGEAEAKVHGMPLESVHFHEVGAIDSIVDIVGAAIGIDLLGADQIVFGPIPTGSGEIRIEHGICNVPTPGTAELLKGIPLREIPVQGELTTPTGAAIVRVVADRFGKLPSMSIQSIGHGAGQKNLPDRANILRLFIGEAAASTDRDEVVLLETNLDNISGEIIGYTQQCLMDSGALDVFTIAAQMKKNRPGTLFSVLCRQDQVDAFEEILFRETGTLGIRRQTLSRSIRPRQPHTVHTEFGPVQGKIGWQSGGVAEFAPEFEDCARVAKRTQTSLRDVYRAATIAFDASQVTAESFPPAAPTLPKFSFSHDHDHDHGHPHDH